MIPCGDKLLIKPDPIPETDPGKVIIKPETAFTELVSGEVMAVHTGFYATDGTLVPCKFEVGDRVYYQISQGLTDGVIPDLVLVQEAAIVMREEREHRTCTCGEPTKLGTEHHRNSPCFQVPLENKGPDAPKFEDIVGKKPSPVLEGVKKKPEAPGC